MTKQLLTLTKERTELHKMSNLQPFNGELQMRYRKFRNHITKCVNMARYDKCCGNTNEKICHEFH